MRRSRFASTCTTFGRALALAVLVLSFGSGLAHAVPSFNVSLLLNGRDLIDNSSAFNRISTTTGLGANTGVSDTWSIPFESVGSESSGGGIVSGTTAGLARGGLLGVGPFVHGASFGDGQAAGFIMARASASFVLDDVIFTYTGTGTPPAFMTTELPMFLDGLYVLDATFGGPFTNVGLTHAEVLLQIRGVLPGSVSEGELRASRTVTLDGVHLPVLTLDGRTSGLLSGYTGGDLEILFPLTAPVGVKSTVGIFMQSETSGTLSHFGSFAGNMDASAAGFLDTLSFRPASAGPVFNLPPDFTANSPSGYIVDNRWNPPSASVPEPTSGWLIAAGALALAWHRVGRRRRAHDAPSLISNLRCRGFREARRLPSNRRCRALR